MLKMKDKGQHRVVLFAMACVVGLWAAQPAMGLVVSELMYHPVEVGGTPSGDENLEFIELYNNRAVFEDLSGYAFTNGIKYTFGPGTIIGGKEYLVVARNPSALGLQYADVPEDKIFGPFEMNDEGTKQTSLNNDGERVELSNANGEIIISFRYNDTWPWPKSADGTGHTLILARPGGDPEEASTWSPSTFIGGTPGGPDEVQVEPEDPTRVNLVKIGHPGRYFKGTEEPSPAPGGAATTAWTQRTFDDDPNTTSWLDGPSGYGYCTNNDPSEAPFIKTSLTDMQGSYLSVYARLRFTLRAEQISSFSALGAEVRYDDDYVLYLNGTRVAGSDGISGNPPPFSAGRSGGHDPSPDTVDLTARMNLLVVGTNVVAIQAHNCTNTSSSDALGSVEVWAVLEPEPDDGEDPRARVVINELLANSDAPPGTDWLELYNPGPVAVDLNNVYLSDGRFDLLDYRIPDGIVLQPGDFWAVRQGAPPNGFGFGLKSTGETVFLTAATNDPVPQPIRVLDALRFGVVEADVTLGRFPDGADNFVALSSATYEGANAKPLIRDIVINEIMYHHADREHDPNYEYVELYNKGTSTVSLLGWTFTDGISYDFNEASQVTEMAPGAYVVVAKNPTWLEAIYGNLTQSGPGANLVGPYSGSLDDHSERVRLSYPSGAVNSETGEPYMVTVDEVTYYDAGRWPIWADGQGASLELRDPRSNNNTPDAWADSDESAKTRWKYFSHTVNDTQPGTVNVFGLMLLNRGDVLIDDLEVRIGGSNRLSNGNFESGESGWRILGNHVQSFVTTAQGHIGSLSQVLHLVATGHGDPGNNRINQSIGSVTASTVTFSFWAKWLRGSRYLLLRTTQERTPKQPPWPAYSFKLDMPLDLGTPGRQNTAYVSNRGPDILEVRHAPVLPKANEPIVVTACATDNDGVDSVTLYYRSEGTTQLAPKPMLDDGCGDDLITGDSIFTAAIPGVGGGTMRAFYVAASDGSASTRFPTKLEPSADVPDRTCLVRVGDSMVPSPFATYRVWLSNDVISTFRSRGNLSNELLDCTFVYNDTNVFYNTRIRFRGSPFIRGGSGWSPVDRHPYRIDFNPDQKFGDRDEINLDRTEDSNRGPLQERASYWFYQQMGLEFSRQEYIRLISNGNNRTNYEDVRKVDGDYINAWFPDDNDGYIHKIDDYFEYNVAGTSHRNLDEGLKYDYSHPLLKETYRWGFEKRSHRDNDEWGHIFNFAQKMNTSSGNGPAYEAAIESVIHPEHFAMVLAIRHAVGDWDSYGYNRGKNNYFYYAKDEGKWYLLPWDIDFTLGSGNGPSTNIFSVNSGQFPEVARFWNYPKYRQIYLEAFARLVYGPWQTSYGTANQPMAFDKFLDDAADALIADGGDASRRDSIKAYVRDRRAYILTQINIPSPTFEITTNGGTDFCTSDSAVTIMGVAPLQVTRISVNGAPVPADFSGNNVFEVEVPIEVGANLLVLAGLDFLLNPVPRAADSITIIRTTPCAITSITPNPVSNSGTVQLTIHGSGFGPGTTPSVELTSTSEEIGFDALYVQSNEAFDLIDAATGLLDNPGDGVGDETYATHEWINLWNSGDHGEFSANETSFAPPFDAACDNFAVRFTGYIYAPSAGVRYFGINSDEGFTLSIDGQLVGKHATGRIAATTDVTNVPPGMMKFNFPAAGRYYVELDYFENGGPEEIELFGTNSAGGNRQLINHGAELRVYRDITKIDATDIVVLDTNTITCQVNLTGARPETWSVIVTSECDEASVCNLDNALQIVVSRADFNDDSRVNFLDWTDLAEIWRQPCSVSTWCDGIDLDQSGSIGFGDVAIFAQEWLLGDK
ncbi:MAG: lamin tail domain-containing protein [Planctomycetes bacterium]|nr:lamin tail domain-containing protein [Planctomycetota bacterium]